MFKTARNLIALGIGLSTSALVGWLLLKESKRQPESGAVKVRSQRHAAEGENLPAIKLPLEALEEAAPPEPQPEAEAEVDDFTKINGIGPRYAEALVKVGITRFEQLAAQTPEALAEMLSPHVRVRAERISDKDWIGQAARLAQQTQ